MMRTWTVVLVSGALLLGAAACGGGDEKKESATADETLKKEKAKAAEKGDEGKAPAPAKVAKATPAAAGDKKAPAPAPAPEPEDAAPDKAAPIPQAEVANAVAFVRRGQYEQAIVQAKAALKRNEKYAPAMVVLARAYYQLNKNELAEAVCDIALQIDSTQGDCYVIKGFVALRNENDPGAKDLFEKATKAKPSLGAAWLNLGVQYLKVKNYTAAITALEEAARLMANRAEVHLNLGSAYRGAGAPDQLSKAASSYSKALQLRPNYPAAYFNLGILYLDAQAFPGMTKLQQLNMAVSQFNSYKRVVSTLPKDDPVDGYIKEAQKAYEREQKAMQREAQRKAREAAKKAAPAPAPAPKAAPKK